MRIAKAIACKISRGGFSDERVFSFEVDGEQYSGVASRLHMWTAQGAPLEEGEPPIGQTIDGLVATRILKRVDQTDRVLVSVPDGGVLEMPLQQLQERPAGMGQDVSIGS